MKWPAILFVVYASYYSTESCRFNRDPACPTASGRSLNDLEKSGERFAASWDYDFGTRLRVTNAENGRSVEVVVLDRGPAKRLVREGRVIDLSRLAFEEIADLKKGIIPVTITKIKES